MVVAQDGDGGQQRRAPAAPWAARRRRASNMPCVAHAQVQQPHGEVLVLLEDVVADDAASAAPFCVSPGLNTSVPSLQVEERERKG